MGHDEFQRGLSGVSGFLGGVVVGDGGCAGDVEVHRVHAAILILKILSGINHPKQQKKIKVR